MQVVIHCDGRKAVNGSALLCHNERLADPLNPYTRAVAEISGKRKKSEADHLELARREFEGGLYWDDELGPIVPAQNILRCIEGGARRIKRGRDVNRGIVPLHPFAVIDYAGPRNIQGLWDEQFWLRKGVGVGTKKVIRTRPLFEDWQVTLPIEVDPVIWDMHVLETVCDLAGKYEGLGDMRPIQGRCTITAAPLDEWLKLSDGNLSAIAEGVRARIAQIRGEQATRSTRHSRGGKAASAA